MMKKAVSPLIFLVGGIVLVLIILGAILTPTFKTAFHVPTAKLFYPMYTSICCEAGTYPGWVETSKDLGDRNSYAYTCSYSTECKFLTPEVDCSGAGFFYNNPQWKVTYKGTSYCSQGYWGSGCNQYVSSIELETDRTDREVYVELKCEGKLLGERPPTSATFNYKYLDTKLYEYTGTGSHYDVPGTSFCYVNKAYEGNQNVEKDQYKSTMDKAVQVYRQIGLDTGLKEGKTIGEVGVQLSLDECYVAVKFWDELPAWGNINPLGQYQGKNVMVQDEMGIYEVTKISTVGGVDYYVPTSKLSTPEKFCTSHEWCRRSYGMKYNCVDYSCKEIPGYCKTDIDCQPAGGLLQDKNCYREEGTMNFFNWGSRCVKNKCTEATQTKVACCDSYCSAQGLVCHPDDYANPCQKAKEPVSPCPSGKCCGEGSGYIVNPCPSGQNCCNVVGGVGTCQTAKCDIVTKETYCNDGIDNDADGATDCYDSDCVGEEVCKVTGEAECLARGGKWIPPVDYSWWENMIGFKDKPGVCRIPHISLIGIILLILGIFGVWWSNEQVKEGQEKLKPLIYISIGITLIGILLMILASIGLI